MTQPLDIAVIGSGVSGLSAAWLLSRRHRVTLYEAEGRLGGHSNTVATPQGVAVDTGFIVYNEATYPNLTALFAHLGVPTKASDMSFAVSLDGGRREYAAFDDSGLRARKRDAFSPRFWSMVIDLMRFYRRAARDISPHDAELISLGDYLDAGGYGRAFQDDHLLPQAAAIWSASPDAIRDYPACAFVRFFENHGLLKLAQRPRWRTVAGGSRAYVERMAAGIGKVRLNAPVERVWRSGEGVFVSARDGRLDRFDHAVLATHADQALRMLGDPDGQERELLGAFRYTRNLAVLHTDPGLMPRRRQLWASWNYVGRSARSDRCSVTYWMNRLQGLQTDEPLFVTLNPHRPPAPDKVIRAEMYEHPLFDAAAVRAQRRLWALQGRRNTWFCGAHFGAGFHEDGLQAGLAVAEELGGVLRPWTVTEPSGRIFMEQAA